jgi:hypothetical protein
MKISFVIKSGLVLHKKKGVPGVPVVPGVPGVPIFVPWISVYIHEINNLLLIFHIKLVSPK